MRRRDFITLLSGAAAVPCAASAQQKLKVVGYLYSAAPWRGFSPLPDPSREGPMRKGLRETGYIDGQNVRLEYRFAEGDYGRLPALAADLVSRKVDVIFTNAGTPGALAAKEATSTIPTVFVFVSDPVGVGLVASLARPGGNMTGFSDLVMTGKSFELLSELVPHARTIALITNPDNPYSRLAVQSVREAASATGISLAIHTAKTEAEIDAAFISVVDQQADALVVDADRTLNGLRGKVVALASRYAIPTMHPDRGAVVEGGLIHYGSEPGDVERRAGIYVGRILQGARPADLPVQTPTLFRLVINLKTAKALGLAVPQTLLARADELIE